MHLAEFNLGILRHDWGDPRIRDFAEGLDLVNGVAARSPGFVWRMPEDAMERAQLDPAGPMGGNPRMASTLSVWESVEALEHFVWQTVHRRFYARKAEWYDADAQNSVSPRALRFVMWWVPEGHRPDAAEAMARLRHLDAHGESDHAFGWAHLRAARLWREKRCDAV